MPVTPPPGFILTPTESPTATDAMGFQIVNSSSPMPNPNEKHNAVTPKTDAMGFPIVGAGTPPPGFVIEGQTPSTADSAPTPPPGFQLEGEQPASTPKPTADPNEPWYKKAFDWANTPLTESLGGIPEYREGAGGVERGLEKIASGFTSPLSIALTIGTLGTAGFLESAGASVLKEAGLSAAEIADVAKGSEAAAQAVKTGQGITDAVKAAGVNPDIWARGQDILYNAGLKEADLTGGNIVERGSSQLFRKVGLTPAAAQTASKTMQGLTNAGFTYTQLQQAAQLSPRVLDALKEGDYDHAAEYATEALAGGVLGAVGATHALHTAGELFEPLVGQKLRPSDETVKFQKLFNDRDGAHEAANQAARLLHEESMKALGFKDPETSPLMSKETEAKQNATLAKIYHAVTLGFDKDAAAQHYNAIAEAAGRDDRLPLAEAEGPRPENGQPVAPTHPSVPDNIQELIQNSDLKSKPTSYVDRLLDTYKGVYDGLNDTEQKVADNIKSIQDKNFQLANESGLIGSYVDNYMQRLWKRENPAANRVIADANSGRFSTNTSMARHRVYGSELEGLLRGEEFATENAVSSAAQSTATLRKIIANRKLLDDLRSNFVRGSDGRPAVVLTGSGRQIEGSNGENPITMVSGNKVRDIKIGDNVINHLQNTGDLNRYLDNGTIVDVTPKIRPDNIGQAIDRLEQKMIPNQPKFDAEGNSILMKQIQTLKDIQEGKRPVSDLDEINAQTKPVYVWRPQDYQTIDNSAFRGWNFAVNDPSGNPVLTEADIKVHPEFADYLKTRLGLDDSALKKWGPTRALLKGSTSVKKTLLSLSPFHMMQEALRAVMLGVNPIMKAAPTIDNSPILRRMVDNHLTLEPDYKAIQEHSEGLAGHTGLIDKIPGIGKTLGRSLDWYEDFLFKRYIPNLKARSAELMYEQYQKAHPDWSKDRVAQVASAHVNDTFGGQNWKAMGRSAATQDWARLMLLAPDWLESEMRSGARLFNKDEGGIGRKQVLRMTMAMWGVARVLNLLSTGKPHLEAPFGVAVKNDDGKETVFSMRTLPVDLLHAATDPAGFLKGRLSPVLRAGQEVYSGRDQFGRKLAPGDMWTDVFHNMSPLPLQSLGKMVNGTSPNTTNTDQIVKALGGTAVVYKTEAQKKAAELASNHNEDGPVDTQMLHRHQAIIRLEDQVRSGHLTMQQLQPLRISGDLPEADYKKIVQNYAKTRGMTADQASLYTRASRAPAPELLQIWDLSTPSEKHVLLPILKSTGLRYVRRAMRTQTPQQRMSDAVLGRFMRMESKQ
jgi:hypothetical protein